MTEPNGILDDGVNPCIQLAGKKWPIPLLGPRQNRIVVPAVSRITKRMREVAEAKLAELSDEQRQTIMASATADETIAARLGGDAVVRSFVWKNTDFSTELVQGADTDFLDLLSEAVFWALKRAHPQMARDEFDDMPIATLDMVDAVGTIAQQTGMMRKADPSADPLARAGSAPSPSSRIGTS
jgi:hypothetical protein